MWPPFTRHTAANSSITVITVLEREGGRREKGRRYICMCVLMMNTVEGSIRTSLNSGQLYKRDVPDTICPE